MAGNACPSAPCTPSRFFSSSSAGKVLIPFNHPGHWPPMFRLAFSRGAGLVPSVCPCNEMASLVPRHSPHLDGTARTPGPGREPQCSPCRGCTQQGLGVRAHPRRSLWSPEQQDTHFLSPHLRPQRLSSSRHRDGPSRRAGTPGGCCHSSGVHRPRLGDHQGGLNHGPQPTAHPQWLLKGGKHFTVHCRLHHVSPQKRYVHVLTPGTCDLTLFGNRVSADVIT